MLAAALAGCSGGSVSTASTPTATSVVRQLGCTGIAHQPTPELFVHDDVSAMCHGRHVTVVTFRTDTLRDNWVELAGQFDGISQTGHLYAVADGQA